MRHRAIAALALAACTTGHAAAAPRTEILWDSWGVPHVFATSERELFRAFGYAQMQSHANLLLTLYARARGRAAEYWGESWLESDRYVRTMGVPARARAWYAAQRPDFRRDLDAFAEGLNLYAREHPEAIPDSLRVALPITAVDVLAHAQHVVHFHFMYGQDRLTRDFGGRPRARSGAGGAGGDAGDGAGSNTWAIGPARTAGGHAMLLANPHLAWRDIQLFYEAQWSAPGVNAYGSTLVGFPVAVIAFNDSLGWSHTVNTLDGADTYRLTTAGAGYRWNGAVRPFERSVELIRVRRPDGGVRVDTLVVRRSVHGPVVADSAGTALAVRVAGLDQPHMLEEWWDMMRARNLGEFERALRTLQIPMFNVMYADVAGHILYLFGGRVGARPRGDVAYWAGTVRGDSAATLWRTTLPYARLPRLLDPPSGWLQNANDPPWTATWPLAMRPDTFPRFLAPVTIGFRPQRSAHMLAEDARVSFDDLVAHKHDSRMELADRVLPDLLEAARRDTSALVARAARVLGAWDRSAHAESRGAVLFAAWLAAWSPSGVRATDSALFAIPWRLDSAITTPRGIRDTPHALRALAAAAGEVERRHGALDVAWGAVNRLRLGGRDLPANGAPGDPFGVFRTMYPAPDDDGKLSARAGDTYYAAIEFARPVRAKVLVAYGNATQPGSPHVGDQLELFSAERMRDAWRTRAEIERHLESRKAF